MSILFSDILHYWDHQNGSLEPIVGGAPNFTRAGNAFGFARPNFARLRKTDGPRIEPDGLRLELSQTNQITDDPFDTSGWTENNITSQTAVTSLYDGETAQEVLGDGSAAAKVKGAAGTLTSGTELAIFVVEKASSDWIQYQVIDATAVTTAAFVHFTFSTETLATSGVDDSGFQKVADIGPNGNVVYLIWFTYSGETAGNARELWQQPDRGGTGSSSIFHFAGSFEDGAIIGSAVDGTRATETFYWESAPKPQPMVIYMKYRALMAGDGNLSLPKAMVIGGPRFFDDPRLNIDVNGNDIRAVFDDGTNVNTGQVTISQSPADNVEIIVVFNNDGTDRIIGRKNAGSSSGNSITGSWTSPADWSDNIVSVNSASDGGGKGVLQPQQVKIVTQDNVQSALDGTGTGDEDIMDEMAGLRVFPDGNVSNVII